MHPHYLSSNFQTYFFIFMQIFYIQIRGEIEFRLNVQKSANIFDDIYFTYIIFNTSLSVKLVYP